MVPSGPEATLKRVAPEIPAARWQVAASAASGYQGIIRGAGGEAPAGGLGVIPQLLVWECNTGSHPEIRPRGEFRGGSPPSGHPPQRVGGLGVSPTFLFFPLSLAGERGTEGVRDFGIASRTRSAIHASCLRRIMCITMVKTTSRV